MPSSDYIEFSINPTFFQSTTANTITTSPLPHLIYNQALLKSLPYHSIELMQQVKLSVFGKTISHNKHGTSPEELHASIEDYFNKMMKSHGLNSYPDTLSALYALALSRYASYKLWFDLLKMPMEIHPDSELVLDIRGSGDALVIHYSQKEKIIGGYHHGFIKRTEFKAKQEFTLDISSYELSKVSNIWALFSKELWNEQLLAAAKLYLHEKGKQTLTNTDFFVVTPFLINAEIVNLYVQRYKNLGKKDQTSAQEFITLCLAENQARDIQNKLAPYAAVEVPPPPLPSAVVAGGAIDISSSQPQPQISLEQAYHTAYEDFMQYVTVENYEASQAHNLQQLAKHIMHLTDKQKQENYSLLMDVMNNAKVAVTQPADTNNLSQSLALIEPLKSKNLHRVALAYTALMLGAVIVAASVLVLLASFGVMSTPAIFGISIGSGLLTKGISLATGVVGAGMLAGGMRLFSHRPYEPLIHDVTGIHQHAVDFNSRPAAR